jgi:hypothetical protein
MGLQVSLPGTRQIRRAVDGPLDESRPLAAAGSSAAAACFRIKCCLTPRSFRARPRSRCSRNPNHSHRGSTRPGPKAPTAVAAASAAPTAEEHRNRLGRRNCRPSHGSCSSFGRGPSPGLTGRPDTSDGDMWVQQEAPPARPPRSPPVWTRPRRRLPARRCTGEATFLFACWYPCSATFPVKTGPKPLPSFCRSLKSGS